MVIVETARGYELNFDYKPYIVAELKQMAGVRFQGKERGWVVPHFVKKEDVTIHNKTAMEKFKAKYLKVAPGADAAEQFFKEVELPELTIKIPWKTGTVPYNYQNNCIARGIELKKFINASQPGTGKSLMAIGTVLGLEANSESAFPCLVICPSTLKENWRREWEEKFSNKRALVLTDQNKNTWHQYYRMGMADVFIVNYESLKKYFVISMGTGKKGEQITLKNIKFNPTISLFKSIIIDELHKCKDSSVQQSKLVRGICIGKQIIIGLTGTPVVNKPKDLASQLAIIEQMHHFGGWKYFMDRYCQGGSGAANLHELNGKLNNICFFRKEKKDVLKDLPDKTHEVVSCDITTINDYNLCKTDLRRFLESSGYSSSQVDKSMNGEIMVQIQKLKDISARGKLPEAIELIQEVVDAGEKIVVFVHQKTIADAIMKAFPGSVSVRGQEVDPNTGKEKAQSSISRQAAVDQFQRCARCNVNQENHDRVLDHDFAPNNTNVIVVSMKAGGVGITLTASWQVLFLELPWHPADVEQCSDRCHRLTSKNAVMIRFLLGKNTIDEDIYKLIEEKRKVSDAITGTQTDISTIITDLTKNLFNQR